VELAHTPTSGPVTGSLAVGALALAREAHAGQRRKQSGEPFVEHPISVVDLLAEGAETTEEVLAAAYLHDVVEKTGVDTEQIRAGFGDEVAALVEVLTEDHDLPSYEERKRSLRRQVIDAGRPATVIYAADRVANLRDWTRLPLERRDAVAAALGTTLEERMRLWNEDLEELTAADPSLPFLEQIELELRQLR
jgi:(p)ppGpp synthase/HD superfamily hydrolase